MQMFIDIDGVLLNFEYVFVDWLNEQHGLGLPSNYEARTWDFEELMDREVMHDSWLRFLESNGAGEMPPLVDPEKFNSLTADYDVHLVTNFPQPFMDKRLQNLTAHGFNFDSIHYCGLHPYKNLQPVTKANIIASLREPGKRAIFVDDHPDNCLDVHNNCRDVEVWMMSRRYNRDFQHPGIRRARDWGCLFSYLDDFDKTLRGETFAGLAQHISPPGMPFAKAATLMRYLGRRGGR